ncbi:MAG TPA: crotonase/enoyl-CoA hydratase family protein [Beijerinckiaceae bacterium]|nr:crotonase/enoyl-CoA hydratase family protein [Beijerinckiaceae bacterium]
MSNIILAAPKITPSSLMPAEDIIGEIRCHAGNLPQIGLEYLSDTRTLWITLQPAPKPVFTYSVVDSVHKVQTAIMDLWGNASSSPVMFLAYRSSGLVYTLGGDLDFYLECLAKNDRSALFAYAQVATDVINLNASSLGRMAITLSTVHAKALGGGIDPARSCNIMIAEESARFGYPEVAFNHYPITAVPILSRRVGALAAQQILMSAQEYSAQEFYEKGVLDTVVPDGAGEAWISNYTAKSLTTHAARLGLFSAFHRRAGDLEAELREAASNWVEHIFSLRPLDIAKLQKIVQTQDRMLARMYRLSMPLEAQAAPLEA